MEAKIVRIISDVHARLHKDEQITGQLFSTKLAELIDDSQYVKSEYVLVNI
jgi:hypothetical protein